MASGLNPLTYLCARSVHLEVGDPVQEHHDLVVEVRLDVGLHLLPVRSDYFSVPLSLFDALQGAEDVAKVLAEQIDS